MGRDGRDGVDGRAGADGDHARRRRWGLALEDVPPDQEPTSCFNAAWRTSLADYVVSDFSDGMDGDGMDGSMVAYMGRDGRDGVDGTHGSDGAGGVHGRHGVDGARGSRGSVGAARCNSCPYMADADNNPHGFCSLPFPTTTPFCSCIACRSRLRFLSSRRRGRDLGGDALVIMP